MKYEIYTHMLGSEIPVLNVVEKRISIYYVRD